VRGSGWFIGQFVPPELGLRHQPDVKVKWGLHPDGDKCSHPWANQNGTTIPVLIRGTLRVEFHTSDTPQLVILAWEGDYVVYGSDRKSCTPGRASARRLLCRYGFPRSRSAVGRACRWAKPIAPQCWVERGIAGLVVYDCSKYLASTRWCRRWSPARSCRPSAGSEARSRRNPRFKRRLSIRRLSVKNEIRPASAGFPLRAKRGCAYHAKCRKLATRYCSKSACAPISIYHHE
jgi:hypothetical protein